MILNSVIYYNLKKGKEMKKKIQLALALIAVISGVIAMVSSLYVQKEEGKQEVPGVQAVTEEVESEDTAEVSGGMVTESAEEVEKSESTVPQEGNETEKERELVSSLGYTNDLLGVSFEYAEEYFSRENTSGILEYLKGKQYNLSGVKLSNTVKVLELTQGSTEGLKGITVSLIPFEIGVKAEGVPEKKTDEIVKEKKIKPVITKDTLKTYDTKLREAFEAQGDYKIIKNTPSELKDGNIVSQRVYEKGDKTGVYVYQVLVPVGVNAVLVVGVTTDTMQEVAIQQDVSKIVETLKIEEGAVDVKNN